jgi:hypothetical protein
MGYEAEDHQHGQREQQLAADVFLAEGIDHCLQKAGPLSRLDCHG